jgi:hypothetical protein
MSQDVLKVPTLQHCITVGRVVLCMWEHPTCPEMALPWQLQQPAAGSHSPDTPTTYAC